MGNQSVLCPVCQGVLPGSGREAYTAMRGRLIVTNGYCRCAAPAERPQQQVQQVATPPAPVPQPVPQAAQQPVRVGQAPQLPTRVPSGR